MEIRFFEFCKAEICLFDVDVGKIPGMLFTFKSLWVRGLHVLKFESKNRIFFFQIITLNLKCLVTVFLEKNVFRIKDKIMIYNIYIGMYYVVWC